MTTSAAETPKFGVHGRKSEIAGQSVMTNRIIGVKVVCGPVDAYFVYSLDSLAGHGANPMIEVTRQGNNNAIVLLFTSISYC